MIIANFFSWILNSFDIITNMMRFWGFFVCLFMFWTFSYFLVAQRNRSSSYIFTTPFIGFPCGSTGKESAHSVGDLGLIPGLGRSPGEGKGYPLQYSCLENSMDCIVHEVTKSQTWLSDFHFTSLYPFYKISYLSKKSCFLKKKKKLDNGIKNQDLGAKCAFLHNS